MQFLPRLAEQLFWALVNQNTACLVQLLNSISVKDM